MAKFVLGMAGLSGSGKSVLVSKFKHKFGDDLTVISLEKLVNELFEFGNEGHRQITNFFGNEYLKKNGELNLKKLWKFVYSDFHKLRILDFLLEPIILNKVQEIVDNCPGILIVEVISFQIAGWQKLLTRKIWVKNTKENILVNLKRSLDLPISPEKYNDTQVKLYDHGNHNDYYLFNISDAGQLEKLWLELLDGIGL